MSLTEWRGLFATTCTPFAPRGSNKYKKKFFKKAITQNHQITNRISQLPKFLNFVKYLANLFANVFSCLNLKSTKHKTFLL